MNRSEGLSWNLDQEKYSERSVSHYLGVSGPPASGTAGVAGIL